MIPKKIYLKNKELQDTTTCERMVSIDEPYRDMTEEYVNLSKVWHDASEEPAGDDWVILCEDDSGHCFTANKIIVVELYLNWQRHAEKMWLKRWAYVSDLLPKGGEL